ncbi:hypothetical protein LEP1GSC120_1604 [Leptospira santarosai str. 200702252]|nr:hypothetical protein LEP1GSC130_0691 [Leptospira santarosai str. 200403458]EMO98485.1 hypothetical protein LEP1GSC120_1604 [Leptospira santarosai str. 200702252]
MMILKVLIVFEILIFGHLLLAQQTIKKSESDLEKKVAEEVKKIRELSGESEQYFFELPGRTSEPILKLQEMGMVIIPFLLPYLSDTSETRVRRVHYRYPNYYGRAIIVNRYIGYIINRIADHQFYLLGKTDDDIILLTEELVDMDTIRAFQTLIANWYQKNKDKSLGKRKLDDLQDGFHTNRIEAYDWLGESKLEKYRLPLENKIKELLKGNSGTFKDGEMVYCTTALGKIGNPKSAKILRKVANHLSYDYSGGERTPDIYNVFSAYEALAKLGHKKETLVRLNELKKDYLEKMDGDTQKKFLENLKKAEKW